MIVLVALAIASPCMAAAPIGHFIYIGTSTVVRDSKTGLTWQRSADTSKYSWTDGNAYCSNTVGPVLGGSGWRLPTVKELLSLVDYSQPVGPMVDGVAFPNSPADQFWSGPAPFNTASGYVDFSTGRVGIDSLAAPHLVRCVR